eukprot:Skav211649  [mRNA]  locus=scaffold1290:297060:297389:- [translate_table: standard]
MLCRALRLAGILCIAVDYRYWPQSSIDGMVEDVNCAVQWCFDNAGKYGGDPKCISLLCCIGGCARSKRQERLLEIPCFTPQIFQLQSHWSTSWDTALSSYQVHCLMCCP